jgi:hypothetical protein
MSLDFPCSRTASTRPTANRLPSQAFHVRTGGSSPPTGIAHDARAISSRRNAPTEGSKNIPENSCPSTSTKSTADWPSVVGAIVQISWIFLVVQPLPCPDRHGARQKSDSSSASSDLIVSTTSLSHANRNVSMKSSCERDRTVNTNHGVLIDTPKVRQNFAPGGANGGGIWNWKSGIETNIGVRATCFVRLPNVVVEEARFCCRALATQSLHIQGASPAYSLSPVQGRSKLERNPILPHRVASCKPYSAQVIRQAETYHYSGAVLEMDSIRPRAGLWLLFVPAPTCKPLGTPKSDQVVRVRLSPLIVGSFCV